MTAEVLAPPGFAADFPRPYAVVDVETTGLSPSKDRVLSIAVVLVAADGAVERRWSTLLDPGCDPGPVHIHGLTRERLAGSPTFAAVIDHLAELLTGRVFVAHNAAFDWKMLAGEALRIGSRLPVEWRLCTVVLSSRLGLDLANLRLGTLAEYWGVSQRRAHDAEDDAEVLATMLPRILERAAGQYLDLPLTRCGTERDDVTVYPPRYSAAGRPPPCPYLNPGPLEVGAPLAQGMRVVFTGHTRRERGELIDMAVAAGLHVTGTVSRRTSLLVTNDPRSGTGKARTASLHGIPMRDEQAFLGLLAAVRPGVARDQGGATRRPRQPWPVPDAPPPAPPPAPPAVPQPVPPPVPPPVPQPVPQAAPQPASPAVRPVPRPASPAGPPVLVPPPIASAPTLVVPQPMPAASRRSPVAARPASAAPRPAPPAPRPEPPTAHPVPVASRPVPAWAVRHPVEGRRILVLGGPHVEAARIRDRIAGLRGVPAVNVTATLALVVLLPGADLDRRIARIHQLGIPTAQAEEFLRDLELVQAPGPSVVEEPRCRVLPRGGVADLPAQAVGGRWTIGATWSWHATDVDLVAFLLGADDQVATEEDFVFYNQPAFYNQPDAAGETAVLAVDGPAEQAISLDLGDMPRRIVRIAIAAALGGDRTFDEVGPIEISARAGDGSPVFRATLDAATTERTMVLAEIYERDGRWRFRAVGQGYDHGLDELARGYGVDIADD